VAKSTPLRDWSLLKRLFALLCFCGRAAARDMRRANPFSRRRTSLIERAYQPSSAMQFEITDDGCVSSLARSIGLGGRGEGVDTAWRPRVWDLANNPDGLEWATPVSYSRVLGRHAVRLLGARS